MTLLSRRYADADEGSNPTEVVMADFEKRLACVIKADGSVVRGYMIDSCELNGENDIRHHLENPAPGRSENELRRHHRQRDD